MSVPAQQYKIHQVTNISTMKSESTVYVKGMRKRTENAGMMGFGASISIEQCDLQQTIWLNDKKKLYYIEPFAQGNDQVIEEEENAPRKQPVIPSKQNANVKGGTIHMWYSITDTGERKKMYGFTARHVWTSQKIKPSSDACSMKDSMKMKTDGWYIDLPQFNCPVHYRPARTGRGEKIQPECMDQFVTHHSGKGKLGFPLVETTTIIMGDGTNQVQTSVETLEFSTMTLDSMLFTIPPGYQLASNMEDLQDKPDVKEMMKDAIKDAENQNVVAVNNQKKPGYLRIGVLAPTGDDQIQPATLQQHMVSTLTTGKIEAIAVSNEEDARKYNCDYTLNSTFTKIKSATKISGILKAIKKTDPNAAANYDIQANLVLKTLSDGSLRSQPNVNGSYEGSLDDAAGKALDDGCKEVLKALKQ